MNRNLRNRSVWLGLSTALSTTLLAAAPAAAQSSASGAPVAAPAAVGEVIVTARRREENLQKVPVAVTALSGAALEARGFTNVQNMEQVTPNLRFTSGNGGNSGSFNAFIRGVGEPDFIVTSDPAVALYIDGVYVARSFGADLDLLDVDRVEVLRGPQGSLFGKNTIGGAVNVTTRKPDGTDSFAADARFGSFDSIRLRAAGTFAITDTLSGSLSGLYRRADGWQTGPGVAYGDEDSFSGRGQLRWRPANGADVLFEIDGRSQRQSGQPHNSIANNLAAPFPAFYGAFFGPCCEITADPDQAAARSPYQRDDADAYNMALTASVPLAGGSLKSITAYRNVDAFFGRGINSANPSYYGDFHDEKSEQFSQELQYTHNFWDDRVKVLGGFYYFRERSLDHTQLYVAPGLALQPGFPDFLQLVGLPPAFATTFDVNLDFDNRQTTKNYAVFGDVNIAVTDKLSLELGGRYTYEQKNFYQKATRIFTQVPLIPEAPDYVLDDIWRAFTPKATVSYQATPDLMFYLTYSEGFRSGGFNGRPTQFPEIGSYDPETLQSVEGGLKSTFFDRRLRLNLTTFYNKYKNQQVQVNTVASDGVTIIARTENAGKSHMYGVEGEFTAIVDRHVAFDGSFGWLDSAYDTYISNGADLSYLHLREAPRWTGNLGVNLTSDQIGPVVGTLRVDAAYKSRTEIDALNSPYLSQGGNVIGNINLTADVVGTGLSFRFTVENFTNERVIQSGFDVLPTFGVVEAYYNPPRRFYGTIAYRF